MTKKITFFGILLTILSTVFIAYFFSYTAVPTKITQEARTNVALIHATYPADYSKDEVLVGAAHNIFIGRIIQKISSRERGIGPETQFEVEVIDNIKGSLSGVVKVNQQGGYRDGKLLVMEGDYFTEGSDNESLLQPGSTYLLTTRYNQKENWHTIVSYPEANKLLSANIDDKSQLRNIAVNDDRVKELKEAYPNEIYLKADIENNNIRNSYKDKFAVKEEIVEPNEVVSTSTESEELDEENTDDLSTTTDETVSLEEVAESPVEEVPEETEVDNFTFTSETVEQ